MRIQKKLNRMEPGSKNYQQAVQKYRLLHERVANQRRDFLHKESSRIANGWDAVCMRRASPWRAATRTRWTFGTSWRESSPWSFLSWACPGRLTSRTNGQERKASNPAKNLNTTHIFLLFESGVSSCERRQGSRNPLPPFAFFIPFSRRSRYKGIKLCGLKPQNGEGNVPLRHIFSKKRRQPRCCLRVFFPTTGFYKILCHIRGGFVEVRRRKTAAFAANLFSWHILEKKAKNLFSRLGNGMPPAPLPDFNGPSLQLRLQTIEIIRRS